MFRQPMMMALLLAFPSLPLQAAEGAPGRGLKEIPDPELSLMRGRYTVGGNNVAWFGVTMVSQWQASNGGLAIEARFKLSAITTCYAFFGFTEPP